jgi:hypothetical protein
MNSFCRISHLLLLFLGISFLGCNKENSNTRIGDFMLNPGALQKTKSTANNFEVDYSFLITNKNSESGELIPQMFFHFDSAGVLEGNKYNGSFTIKSAETTRIDENTLLPASIFLLLDRNGNYTSDGLSQFRQAIFKNLYDYSGSVEYNIGYCEFDNQKKNVFKIMNNEFQQYGKSKITDDVNALFNDFYKTENLIFYQAIDSVLDYIAGKANYSQRILIIPSAMNWGEYNPTLTKLIIEKANRLKTIICFYTAFNQSLNAAQSAIEIVNGTKGFFLSNSCFYGSTDDFTNVSIKSLFNYLSTGELYKSKITIEVPNSFFTDNFGAFIKIKVKTYKHEIADFKNVLYP